MRFAVMGAGALGGYFGGRLAAAGHEVVFIARGAQLTALRGRGLKIISPKGNLHLPEVIATDDPRGIGPVDTVLFMVKNQDVESAARAIAPLLGPQTMVVTCQNGVTAPYRLGDIIGADRVVGGVVRAPGDVAEPGVIRHSAPIDIFLFGELDGSSSDRTRGFHAALSEAGCMPELTMNIRCELWLKMVMQATLASMCALTRLDVGPMLAAPATAELFRMAMEETVSVARKVLPDFPRGAGEGVWAFIKSLPPTVHASMLDDLNRGKPLEVDYLSGDVVRIGRENGVPTPIHDVFWAALQPFRLGAPT